MRGALVDFEVAIFFVGRTFSLIASRVLRLPSTENASVTRDGVVLIVSIDAFSHGKPGGDDGGVDARAPSSEDIAGLGLLILREWWT